MATEQEKRVCEGMFWGDRSSSGVNDGTELRGRDQKIGEQFGKKIKLDLYLTLNIRINSKWIRAQKVKDESTQALEDNMNSSLRCKERLSNYESKCKGNKRKKIYIYAYYWCFLMGALTVV